MLASIRTGKFKNEFALAEKRGKNMDKLIEVKGMIIREEPLPPERRNHLLHSKWECAFECHIEPNWLLIYEIDRSANRVTFYRTRAHCSG